MLSYEEDLERFEYLTTSLWSVLEDAIRLAKDFFIDRVEEVDDHLFSPLVRYFAKIYLTKMGFTAKFDSPDYNDEAPHLEVLANNGLEIKFEHHSFRLLKTSNGEVPVPGPSQRKQEFYQQLPLPLDWSKSESEEQGNFLPNRIILWQVDAEHKLERLYLVAPKAGDTVQASVETYYLVPIPHPSETIQDQHSDVDDDLDDIVVTPKEHEAANHSDSDEGLEKEVTAEEEDDLR